MLETNPKRVYKIFLSDSLKPDKRIDAMFSMANQHKITVARVPRQKLDMMLANNMPDVENAADLNHQGVIASVAPKVFLEWHTLLKRCEDKIQQQQKPLVLVLDEVTDPRNFGAMLRVCDGAGVEAVIIPKQHSVGFGPMVSKTASGADETVDVVMVPNIAQSLQALQKIGFWTVGASSGEGAQLFTAQDYKMPVALVMGSEGKGIRPLVTKQCDFLVKIPMAGMVDSLNVSVATGILTYEIKRQQNAG